MTIMERATPPWCRGLMELSLWGAVFTGVFLEKLLGPAATRAACTGFIALFTVTWLLHWAYLHWFPAAFSFSLPVGILLAAYILIFRREELGDGAWNVLLCLPVFLALPGAFTERQVTRFLAFLGAAGILEVLLSLFYPTIFEKMESLTRSLQEGGTLAGTLASEGEAAVFLGCAAMAALAFAFFALARLAPERTSTAPAGQAGRLASAGFNLALLGFLSFLLSLAALYLCRSLFPFATFVLTGILAMILFASKDLLSTGKAVAFLLLLAAAGTLNLSRPAPGSDGLSTAALSANAANLVQGRDRRATAAEAGPGSAAENLGAATAAAGEGAAASSASPEGDGAGPGWAGTIRASDFGAAMRVLGPVGFWLLILFLLLLVIEGLRSLALGKDVPAALQGAALAGLFCLLAAALWCRFTANCGLVILAAAFAAMVSAGGEYDEEFEEIEIVS